MHPDVKRALETSAREVTGIFCDIAEERGMDIEGETTGTDHRIARTAVLAFLLAMPEHYVANRIDWTPSRIAAELERDT